MDLESKNKKIEETIYNNSKRLFDFFRSKIDDIMIDNELFKGIIFSKYDGYLEDHLKKDRSSILHFIKKTKNYWEKFIEIKREGDISFIKNHILSICPDMPIVKNIVESNLVLLDNMATEEKTFVFSIFENNIKFTLRYLELNKECLIDLSEEDLYKYMLLFKVKKTT
jgi:hypothetical protein